MRSESNRDRFLLHLLIDKKRLWTSELPDYLDVFPWLILASLLHYLSLLHYWRQIRVTCKKRIRITKGNLSGECQLFSEDEWTMIDGRWELGRGRAWLTEAPTVVIICLHPAITYYTSLHRYDLLTASTCRFLTNNGLMGLVWRLSGQLLPKTLCIHS